MVDCGLCQAYNQDYRTVFRNDDAVSVVITNPVNDGHLMILPRRHVIGLNDLTAEEAKAVYDILHKSQHRLMEVFPDAPPIFAMQADRHSSQLHIHYQMFPSDIHIRALYGAAHPDGSLKALSVPRERTHPNSSREMLEDITKRLRL